MADKVYGTSNGRPVDESEIGRLAVEAEEGYDPDSLRRRGGRRPMGSGPADVVPVRLDPELKSQVESRAQLDHVSTSEVIREALRRYLDVA
ncbi:MAG TPA: ribbon-helix-helix protein, CopG family [Microthrixaceae bacterium]|nr:ribbon-helix-helix protein, CopG family [Microthrixaceae bacterium]TXI42185.1 MAG: ribbon-helix-helix protein, CopG family [Mycobacterium sp.]HNI36416.1 ribbon-helix-helix protein, CopG family [Microthrixaceae bacterium]